MLLRRTLFFIVLALVWQACHSNDVKGIIINEVMQSNINYLMVEKDYPDSWVELYNASNQDISLKGYSIGLTSNCEEGYQIPDGNIIKSKGYLVINCDKENRDLHTNSRLDSGKGDLYLFDEKCNLVDELHLKKMPAPNVAYGRLTDGSDEWQYEIEPSAGGANTGKVSSIVLPDPVFSIEGGTYDTPVDITISLPDISLPKDTKIYVTYDGGEPTK